ncbi:MAG TPA: hypothetical protein VK934_13465 [Fimbriimonas sp.]|nr:hypothetical protein [Fimbriimonas sp.]
MTTLFVSGLGYIDSGTGSVLVQMTLAGVLGASFMARNFWAVLLSKLTGKKKAEQ